MTTRSVEARGDHCAAPIAARDPAREAGRAFSATDVLIAVCARRIVGHRLPNAARPDDRILQRTDSNIGAALALEVGLVVPVEEPSWRHDLVAAGRLAENGGYGV